MASPPTCVRISPPVLRPTPGLPPSWHPRVPSGTQTGLALGPLPPNPGRILRSHLKPHFLRGHLEPHQSECPWYQHLPGAGQRCGLVRLAPSLPDHNLHLNKTQVGHRHPEVPGPERVLPASFPSHKRAGLCFHLFSTHGWCWPCPWRAQAD